MRILSVSCGRSDIGILTPVWNSLSKNLEHELHVILTGAHNNNLVSNDIELPPRSIKHLCGASIQGQTNKDLGSSLGSITADVVTLTSRIKPDRILIVGDRIDMMAAVLGASCLNIPLVHLHGGEFSYGAIDERLRHAITKLSHLHCTSNQVTASVISKMGEESWRIHVTGAPGLDTLINAELLDAKEIAKSIGLKSISGLRLITVHPETNSLNPLATAQAVFSALKKSPAPNIVTAPNADPGSKKIRDLIIKFVNENRDTVFIENLGNNLYANVMRHASVMVGNSSSGIVEAGIFGLPVINVGGRQDGRQYGINVSHVSSTTEDIVKKLASIPAKFDANFIYGDGYSGDRVAKVLTNHYDHENLLFKKFSYNIHTHTNPWELK
tara:strand:- start:1110 stop:2261 length:1152 start_codon:yes stop_codon:yes gene_type:complete